MRRPSILAGWGVRFEQIKIRLKPTVLFSVLLISLTSIYLFGAKAQEETTGGRSGIELRELTTDLKAPSGIVYHRQSDALIVSVDEKSGSDGMELGNLTAGEGARLKLKEVRLSSTGHLAVVRQTRGGFVSGEVFYGTGAAGEVARLSSDGAEILSPWITLPGEAGQVRGLTIDQPGTIDQALIAVTTQGGVWRIESTGFAQRISNVITRESESNERNPVSFEDIAVLPDDPQRYGPWAGRILAASRQDGSIFIIDRQGQVSTFDPGIEQVNNLLVIPAGENLFGIVVEPGQDQGSVRGSIWGAPAHAFDGMEGDLLVTQGGGQSCKCRPALWRVRWDGEQFKKSRLGVIESASGQAELRQVTFSRFGDKVFEQANQAVPRIGPFGNPGASGAGDANTIRADGGAKDGLTTRSIFVSYYHSLDNTGDVPGNFIVSATSVPPNFKVIASFNSAVGEVDISNGGTITTPRPVEPSSKEQFNLEVHVTAPPGLTINTEYKVVLQLATPDGQRKDLTTDILIPIQPPPPELVLVKSIRDLDGGLVLPGDLLEFTLTLSNFSSRPVTESFIADFIPPTVTYIHDNSRITEGANQGSKTDAIDADQVDFFPTNTGCGCGGQLNIATGTGAGGHDPTGRLIGGTLAPGEKNTVVFQVRVNLGANSGDKINNGADWGGDNIYPGGKSNITDLVVSAPTPLVGPFGNPAAVGPTGNNDDFTLARVGLSVTNGLTNVPGQVRFINTMKNDGTAPGKFTVRAPVIPAGFSVKVSIDSGESFTDLGPGGSLTTPTPLDPGEARNLDVRVSFPAGLAINTDYDLVIEASRDNAPSRANRTIDRVRPDPNPPNLKLVKAVRDLSGRNLDRGQVLQGQTIEYSLTLTNQTDKPVGRSFIAEFIPPNVSYVKDSVNISAGPNAGAKTDKRGDDQVDYYSAAEANGQINIFTGTGAAADAGGVLAPGESTTVVFRVTVNANAPVGTIILNGADWGAEDFYLGGKSNIVTVTVSEGPAPAPLIGPFLNPEAVGPTDNNDDFTLGKVGLPVTNNQTTVPGKVRFVNTMKNIGTAPGKFTVRAPVIPAGFSIKVSVDSGETFTSLDSGGSLTTPTALDIGESRNIDLRVDFPAGLVINTNYDLVIEASVETVPVRTNRTIDRLRPEPNPFDLKLVKGVRDLQGRNLDGGNVLQGQTIEYTLTLTNQTDKPVGRSFIAEFIPPNVSYVKDSVNISAGPNAGAKTDKRGDDQVDYYSAAEANGQINIFTGTGAAADAGGVLAPGESTTVVFRVTVNANAPVGTIILNGADWGAEDFYLGGKSNIVTVTVSGTCPAITISPAGGALPFGVEGRAYSQAFTQTGGESPVTFSVSAGQLPPGLTLNPSTGVLSGTATKAGSYSFTIRATGANGCTGAQDYTLLIYEPCTGIRIQPTQLTPATQGKTYLTQFFASFGVAPYVFSSNNLPSWLNLSSSGLLLGAPPASGTFSFTVNVKDARGCEGSQPYTLLVEPSNCPAVSIAPATLPNPTVGVIYSQAVTAAGGAEPYRFSVIEGAAALPAGLTLNPTAGVISGVPTRTGTFSFTIQATDANGCQATRSYTLVVAGCTPPNITVQPVNKTVTAGQSLTFSVTATGDGLVYQWRRNGVEISGATSGTLTIASAKTGDAGSYQVVVTGACGTATSNAAVLVVNCPAITLSPAAGALPAGTANKAYSQTFTQSGGLTPVTFSLSAGQLPAGLTLDPSTGVLSGTPTQSGTFPFTVKVTDANGCEGSAAYTLVINPCTPPNITVQPVNKTVTAGQSLTFSVTATGDGLVYQWRRNGVEISGATSGTLTIASAKTGDAGSYQVVVTGACGTATSNAAVLVVNCPAITLSPAAGALPAGFAGGAYSQTFTQSGGATPVTFSLSAGQLPAGLTLNPATGRLSGTPAQAGSYSFTVKVTDANGCEGSAAYTLAVSTCTPPSLTTQPVGATLNPGQSVTFSVAATGDGLTYQWRRNGSNIVGATSSMLSIASVKGGDAGSYEVVVTGNCGTVTSSAAVLVVNCPTITLSPADGTLPEGKAGRLYTQTFTQSGGTAPVSFSVGSGQLPQGLSLNPATGVLSGIPTLGGTFSFKIKATDANGCEGSAAYTLVIIGVKPPVIVKQPVSLTICTGESATFTVDAEGDDLTFQWRKNGVKIFRATSRTLTIVNAKESDSGAYDVVITNSTGTVISKVAWLKVTKRP